VNWCKKQNTTYGDSREYKTVTKKVSNVDKQSFSAPDSRGWLLEQSVVRKTEDRFSSMVLSNGKQQTAPLYLLPSILSLCIVLSAVSACLISSRLPGMNILQPLVKTYGISTLEDVHSAAGKQNHGYDIKLFYSVAEFSGFVKETSKTKLNCWN